MFSNKFITKYKNKINLKGFLDISNIEIFDLTFYGKGRPFCCETPVGYYYKKIFYDDANKLQFDAEILLSQVFSKFGFKSAIYFPVTEFGHNFIMSNSLDEGNLVRADYFHKNKEDTQDIKYGDGKCLFYDEKYVNPILKYYEKKAIEKRIKMEILDLACLNPDRVDCNYFYKLNSKGKIEDIETYDYEKSGDQVNNMLAFSQKPMFLYKSELYKDDFALKEIIEDTKHNEQCSKYFHPKELAEEMGKVSLNSVATDIKHSIGYKVESKYVDTLQKNFDLMEELLIK